MSALSKAIINGRWRQAHLLVEAGFNVNCRGTDRRTSLIELCFQENENKAAALARKLINKGAQVGLEDYRGRSALSHACLLGRRKLVDLFTKCIDYDLNSADHEWNTALFHAVTNGDREIVRTIVKKLKQYSLSVDKKNRLGETPLVQAFKKGHLECADILIREGKASLGVYDMENNKRAEDWDKDTRQNMASLGQVLKTSQENEESQRKSGKPRKQISSVSASELCVKFRTTKSSVLTEDQVNINLLSKNTSPIREHLPNFYRIYNEQNSSSFRVGYRYVPKQINFRESDVLPEWSENEIHATVDFCDKIFSGKHKVALSKIKDLNTRLKDLNATATKNQKFVNSVGEHDGSLPDLFEKRLEERPNNPSTSKGGSRAWPKVHRALKVSTSQNHNTNTSVMEDTLPQL